MPFLQISYISILWFNLFVRYKIKSSNSLLQIVNRTDETAIVHRVLTNYAQLQFIQQRLDISSKRKASKDSNLINL